MRNDERRADDREAAALHLQQVRDMWLGRLEPESGRALLAEAWERLQTAYAPVLAGLIRPFHLQDADVDEVRQNVWGALLKALLEMRGEITPARLQAWLKKVVRHKAADLFRDRDRHIGQPLAAVVGTKHEPASREADPATRIERLSAAAFAAAALALLHQRGQDLNARILVLHHLEGRKRAEVARLVGLTPAQVRARLRRTQRLLRDMLEIEDIAPDEADA